MPFVFRAELDLKRNELLKEASSWQFVKNIDIRVLGSEVSGSSEQIFLTK